MIKTGILLILAEEMKQATMSPTNIFPKVLWVKTSDVVDSEDKEAKYPFVFGHTAAELVGTMRKYGLNLVVEDNEAYLAEGHIHLEYTSNVYVNKLQQSLFFAIEELTKKQEAEFTALLR